MSTNSEQYWRSQLAQTEAEYEHIIQGLRDEVELQQRRCGELVHEQAMLRSTAAADIRDFCQQYVANVKQQQQQQQQQQARPGSASTWMSHGAKKDIDSVPLPALFAFLHEYSHGLLQLPENRRKRLRQDTQLSPLHHRLRQRMLARHRRTGKEDELMDEWCTGEYGDGSCVTSPSVPYMSAPPSSSWPTVPQWHADPEGKRQMAPLGEGASPDMGGRNVRMSDSMTEDAAKSGSGGASGGAWEAIIDKAIVSVTEFLASTTREFDPEAPLSQHMLALLDRGSLRDILVERNYNELCGRLGCGNKPRGLLAADSSTLSFEWASSSSSSALDAEGDANVDDEATTQATGDHPDADTEEIVYEEDLYTAESFRLAQRQRAMLDRMQRKKLMREQKMMMTAAATSHGGEAAAAQPARGASGGATSTALRVLHNGLFGASFPQRFCSPECEETYESSIMPRVSSYLSYDYPSVFGAITNLFPNLRLAALQQLAGAETSAAGLLKPVVETEHTPQRGGAPAGSSASGGGLKPVQVGVAFESSEIVRRNPHKRGAKKAHIAHGVETASQMDAASPALLLREVLEQMQVLQHVWNNEVVQRFSEAHPSRVVMDAAAPADPFGSTQTLVPLPQRPVLRGSLLLFDFIMNTSCAQTRRLFYAHYARHRPALLRCLSTVAPPCASRKASVFYSVSVDIVAELEKRRVAPVVAADAPDRSLGVVPCEDEDEGLRIDPALQQQRRELLVSHIFSEDVAATLSRLLFVDYVVVANMAWSGVWLTEMSVGLPARKQSSNCSLLRSLQFPFAVPAVLLQAAGSTPEVLGLAMIYLVAAGCCSEGVWRGCMREEVAFDEVAQAIGLTRDDIAAAVRSLMLGEEK